MTEQGHRGTPDDDVVAASTIGLGIVLRSLAPALERVTLQQWRVLVLLVTRGPMRAGDLAGDLGLLPSGITRMVDRLVRDGFAAKRPSRVSAREVMITALVPASELVTRVLEARRAEFRSMLRAMTPAERASIGTTATALVRVAPPHPLLDAELLLAEIADTEG